MRWPMANRALLTLRSPQFCALGSLRRLPLRRDYVHSKRFDAISSFSTPSNRGRSLSYAEKERRKSNTPRKLKALLGSTLPARNEYDGSAQRNGGSRLQEDREDTLNDLRESELEFSMTNLRRTVRLPTQDDLSSMPSGYFRMPWKAVATAVQALGGTHSVQPAQSMLSGSGKKFSRTDIIINLPGNDSVVAAGDGCSPERAKRAAGLHALAKMRDMDVLTFAGSQSKEEFEDEKEGMMDIYNYAARYRCVPSVSIRERRGLFSIAIDMPQHGINVAINVVGSVAHAEAAAALEFKNQAELYHLRRGADTVVVRDPHSLSTRNAPGFFIYCRDQGEHLGAFNVSLQRLGEMWVGTPVFGRPDLQVDPKVKVRTRSKDHAVKIAKLVGALSVLKTKPHLFDNFSKALQAGNGKYLGKPRPTEVVLNPEVLQELNAIQALGWPHEPLPRVHPVQFRNEPARHTRPKHALTQEQIAMKSFRLKEKMDEYKTRGDLEHLRQTRSELPMAQYASRVRQIVHDNVYCVVIGATGSGKTTQVPQILLDQAIESGTGASCNVICTQPRRIAATSVARRVAGERAEQLQETVGYHVRFDAKLPNPGGSILYCTAGILLQQLQHAPDDVFDHISHLVIDEVHERDLINDFLLTTLKYTMAARAAQGKKLPRVVLMSATIDAGQFAAYFRNSLPSADSTDCPTLNVPGRTFPVQEYYLDEVLGAMKDTHDQQNLKLLRTDKKTVEYLKAEKIDVGSSLANADTYPDSVIDWKSQAVTAGLEDIFHSHDKDDGLVPLGLAATAVAHITKTSESGAILVFLPGWDEIKDVDELLRAQSPLDVDFNDPQRFQIIMLHSSIQDSQKRVFDPVPERCRKIILSTNIAETSVTIPDVQFVVDTGKCREKRYDQTRRITQLQCTWISKSNAKQRAGRAGRVQDGVYYALFTRSRRESMRTSALPELLRSDLQETCLDVKTHPIKMPVAEFLAGAIEPPPPSAVETAMQNLVSLGALTKKEELTPLGRVLASLPVHPTLGKMIILGVIFRCLDPMITLGAAAHQRPLITSPLNQRSAVDEMKKKLAGPSESDHIMLLEAFGEARQASARGGREAYNMFRSNFMSRGAFKNIDMTARDIVGILTKAGLIENQNIETTLQYGGRHMNANSGSEALVKALLVAGLYPNLAVQTRPDLFRTSSENNVRMHPSSVNDELVSAASFFTYNSLSLSSDGNSMYLRESSSVTPLMALLFGGPLVPRGAVLEMDQWLPMFIMADVPGTGPQTSLGGQLVSDQVLFLRRLLDRVLAAAFRDLASKTPLAEDPMRSELVFKLVRVLNREAGDQGNLRPGSPTREAGLEVKLRPAEQLRWSRAGAWPGAANRPSSRFGASITSRQCSL
ncbi:hypothetical protein INS49_004269 [Diaporthe citri]|uniref:uncharacterized protein n=1 Tax=Diaporthe citri TaxID=83186 RepID=UPI001C818E67|nr:uncharacterized protein INS49_004269 [Diaporthe citri]KAG6355188.1 hypothetical protein INS49_004269 [Diaporthe citri]